MPFFCALRGRRFAGVNEGVSGQVVIERRAPESGCSVANLLLVRVVKTNLGYFLLLGTLGDRGLSYSVHFAWEVNELGP